MSNETNTAPQDTAETAVARLEVHTLNLPEGSRSFVCDKGWEYDALTDVFGEAAVARAVAQRNASLNR